MDPLYFGDYPESMRDRLGDQLPEFSEEDKELLKSSTDFIGLNQYTSRLVSHAEDSVEEGHFEKAQQVAKIGNIIRHNFIILRGQTKISPQIKF